VAADLPTKDDVAFSIELVLKEKVPLFQPSVPTKEVVPPSNCSDLATPYRQQVWTLDCTS
jgi:hypothetical protein